MTLEREVSPDREIIPVLELWKDDEVTPEVASPVLVGRLVADFKRYSAKVIGEGLTRIWNLRQQVKVSEVQDNTFVFHFSSIAEKERIVAGSPWSFGGFMLCLKEWPASFELEAIEFDHVELWVQVSGLSPNQMTRRKATMIGTLFASVAEVDLPLDNCPFWGKFFKMKVVVGTANPLPTGFLNKSQGDSASWVSFQYFNLVDYCYYYARMGHVEKECPFLSEDRRKRMVRKHPIPGIYELRAPKSSTKLLTVRSGGFQSPSRPGRVNPGKKAREAHPEAKHVGTAHDSGTRDQTSGFGCAARVTGAPKQNIRQKQCQDCPGTGSSSKIPNQTQTSWKNVVLTESGELSTHTSSTAATSFFPPHTPHTPSSSKKRKAQSYETTTKKLKPSPSEKTRTNSCTPANQTSDPLPPQPTEIQDHVPVTNTIHLDNFLNLIYATGPQHTVNGNTHSIVSDAQALPTTQRLSLKKQARLRTSVSPASLPPKRENQRLL
ncbi:hypothetical protein Tsubulata_049597 [Turnera subulata]|uniref:DUF4283 domain-containing protein n=1 Tax=Turnera subulata TaxID=218843 RepID=A0A9Q0FSN3_9ROSI|nr:hypothetical protein Tsubulata_049597 [Turnera subulata]